MSDVPFAICEVFHSVLLTTGLPAGISTVMTKLIKNVYSTMFSFTWNLNCHADEMIHKLLSFCHDGFWIRIAVHVQGLNSRLQETEISVVCMIPSLLMLINNNQYCSIQLGSKR
jgi:hypothetical protein